MKWLYLRRVSSVAVVGRSSKFLKESRSQPSVQSAAPRHTRSTGLTQVGQEEEAEDLNGNALHHNLFLFVCIFFELI